MFLSTICNHFFASKFKSCRVTRYHEYVVDVVDSDLVIQCLLTKKCIRPDERVEQNTLRIRILDAVISKKHKTFV